MSFPNLNHELLHFNVVLIKNIKFKNNFTVVSVCYNLPSIKYVLTINWVK